MDPLRNLLEAVLGLEKTPLPYIDATDPKQAGANRVQAKESK
jgi:hypothetical protein